MTRLNGTSAAALLVVATLALAGCGGDDEPDNSTTGAGTVETTTGTTGTTESGTTRERTATSEDRTGTTKTREPGDDKGGSTSGGSDDDSSGSGSGGGSGSKSQELTASNTFSTARTVCRNFLPKPLEKDLKDGDKSAAEIAKDYSRGFPSELRKKAYDGCLAGLKGKD